MTRKFIIAEALYMNYGDLAPLPKLVSPASHSVLRTAIIYMYIQWTLLILDRALCLVSDPCHLVIPYYIHVLYFLGVWV